MPGRIVPLGGATRSRRRITFAHGIVQDQVDEVERDNPREPLGEVRKQLSQVPMRRNRFRNLQQGPILLTGPRC